MKSCACEDEVRYFFDTVLSKSYWQYVLFSRTGFESVLAIFGFLYLLVESLDFFKIYTRDQYASYAFLIFFVLSVIGSILIRRPIKSILIPIIANDFAVEVRIANIFEIGGAIMISTNTKFEADVAGGKIAPDSLQGQFTARYFTGNQNELLGKIGSGIDKLADITQFPMGTTIPISTHGKTFYFTAMADLNEQGNASTTLENVKLALDGLWEYVRSSGELQELAVPAVGTGRGRLKQTRKRMIAVIAESFMRASEKGKLTDKLVIVVRPEDAASFGVNLYDIKDHLSQVLNS